jgi:hypothetical protein
MTIESQTVPDGQLSLDEVVVYRALRLAFTVLWPEEVPSVADFAISYQHPGTEQKASFEYITGAFSRGDAQIVSAGVTEDELDSGAYQYIFTNKATGDSFETVVLNGVFPENFFELRTKVITGSATRPEQAEFSDQWQDTRDTFLSLELDEIFEVEKEELEPTPYWPIIFTFGLLGVMLVATGVSLLGRKK